MVGWRYQSRISAGAGVDYCVRLDRKTISDFLPRRWALDSTGALFSRKGVLLQMMSKNWVARQAIMSLKL
jgi:hypothetical protein